jgi:hypothetical protein
VQTLTDWGPTEDIEAEGGLLMGQTGLSYANLRLVYE